MATAPLPQNFKDFLKLLEDVTEISGVEFEDCFMRRRRIDLGGIEVNLIDLVDLKTNKRASGRHKDLDDIDHLP